MPGHTATMLREGFSKQCHGTILRIPVMQDKLILGIYAWWKWQFTMKGAVFPVSLCRFKLRNSFLLQC
jgi:hypothetical protein